MTDINVAKAEPAQRIVKTTKILKTITSAMLGKPTSHQVIMVNKVAIPAMKGKVTRVLAIV